MCVGRFSPRYREFLRLVTGGNDDPDVQTRKVSARARKVIAAIRRTLVRSADGVGSLRESFRYFDKNGDGQISRKEFAGGLLGFGLSIQAKDIHALLDYMARRRFRTEHFSRIGS